MKKKIISFSLFGQKPIYLQGALINIELAKKYFPDFVCRFYFDNTLPFQFINHLKTVPNIELIQVFNSKIPKTMWRFLAADDPDVLLFISRDTDSRLSARESLVINQWICSNEIFCILKDHPLYHNDNLMLAGLWGMKCFYSFNVEEKILHWMNKSCYSIVNAKNSDQFFLDSEIYPSACKSLLYFDEFNLNNFDEFLIPPKRSNFHFFGEIFDEDSKRDDAYKELRNFYLLRFGFFGQILVKILKVARV
jgi:protein O-GlcNAc transferase